MEALSRVQALWLKKYLEKELLGEADVDMADEDMDNDEYETDEDETDGGEYRGY